MKPSLFNFIGEFSSTLEELALQVEDLLVSYPSAAVSRARLFGEVFVSMIFEQEQIREVDKLPQWEKVKILYQNDLIPDDIYMQLEFIRKNGNDASHKVIEIEQEMARRVHRTLYDLCVWYGEVYVSHNFRAPSYEFSSNQHQEQGNIKQWMEDYVQEMQQRIAEIEEELKLLKHEKKEHKRQKVNDDRIIRTSSHSIHEIEQRFPLERFEPTLESFQLKRSNLTKKAAEFQHQEYRNEFIYLLTNKTPTMVIHPALVEESELLKGLPTKPSKSTALRKFPKKEENGKLMSNYGYAYTFQTNSELEGLLQRILEVMKVKSLV